MTGERHPSLSHRLITTLIVASLGYWAVVVGVMIKNSVAEAYELFDSNLAQTALALLHVSDPDDPEPRRIPARTEPPSIERIVGGWPHLTERRPSAIDVARLTSADATAGAESLHALYDQYERRLRYQIWSEGRLLLSSSNAPTVAMTDLDGFSEITDEAGDTWRLYGVWDQHRSFRVLVAEAVEARSRLLRSIALDLVKPMVMGLPVLLLLLLYSIRRSLAPLRALAEEIAKKRATSLTPVDPGSSLAEARPMVQALNELLQRVDRAMANERCFTANAAHELRTPLAAIQAHLAAARTATTTRKREQSLDQLQRGLDRGIRLVGQLLTLARLDPEEAVPDAEPQDIGLLLESVCAELAPLALKRGQVMELAVAPNLPAIVGNGAMLAMLFSNVIDNALRYTQDGGHIGIDAHRETAGLLVEVTDDGPGIPESERQRVFERFCRLADQSRQGTGLGLAICRRVAELHGVLIELTDGPGGRGLTVKLWLLRPKKD